jgi:hypothetical protein
MSSTTVSPLFIKSASSALVAVVLDRYILGEQDMYQSVYFGVATGLGVGAGYGLAQYIPALIPNNPDLNFTGQGLMERTFEIGGSLGATYVLDQYLSKPDNASLTSKLLVALASDFAGEYIKDWVTTAPLVYLS